jgi:MerR family transcriptional regulator, light-induced transcriptional regulator
VNDRASIRAAAASIAMAERDTGLSKDTLRVWERRYGFPMPLRNAQGERSYSLEQIEKLRVIKRLLDHGHRPSRIVMMSTEELLSVSDGLSAADQRMNPAGNNGLDEYLAHIKSHDVDGLRRVLGQSLMRMGLGSFVCDLVAPLTTAVGDAWMRGQMEVFEEHMYTECVNRVLRNAMGAAPESTQGSRPKVLLTTFPQEPHGLGLLMAEAMFSMEACRCVSLGTQTPMLDLTVAATAHNTDIVALSFTAAQNPNDVINGLEELRSKLAAPIEIWAGGGCPVIHRRSIEGVKAIACLQDISAHVLHWRSEH